MKIKLIRSSFGGRKPHQFLSSCVINDSLVIDAGCIGFATPLSAQKQIQHVLLSHSHLDHIASLPFLLDNIYAMGSHCVTVYGCQHVLDCLRRDIFNDRVWPNVEELTRHAPLLALEEIQPEQPFQVAGLTVTAIELDHVVPTVGFVLEDKKSAIAFISDTAPTRRIWDVANGIRHLKAVFLETSFPNGRESLAEQSRHLTPRMLAEEVRKLKKRVPVIVVHIKPAFLSQIVAEIASLGMKQIEVGEPGKEYLF